MLAKASRLTAPEVRAILKEGRSVRTPSLSAKYIRKTGSKVAVVVSSKVEKTAVGRNRLRRSAYDALRGAIPAGVHAVLFLQKPEVKKDELKQLCLKLS